MTETKVLIVGLDGGTFKKIKPWLESKQLPLLSRLYDEGCHAQLRAFFPTLSPLEWACFYTGKTPSKLGLFALSHVGDLKQPISSYRVMDSTAVNSRSFWGLLAEQGVPVGVVNIPATYPPEKVKDGFVITGYLTPTSAKDFFYPESIAQYLDGYKIESEFEYMPDKTIQPERLLEELRYIANRRTDTILRIVRSNKVRLIVVNYKEVDVLQHVFWDDDRTLLEFMKFVDNSIKSLAEELQPSHIFVMSDHGFHEAESEYFYINTWLKQKGLLVTGSGVRERFWVGAYRFAVGLSKRSRLVRRLLVSQKDSASKYASLQVDLEKSEAYASQYGIFFSTPARMRSNYSDVRSKLRDALLSLQSPSGYRVFDNVCFREELFEGEFLNSFPDLVPIPSSRFLVNPNLYDKAFDARFDRPYLKGAHKSDPNGIFILSGEGVRSGVDLDTVSITDLAPTVLFLFGFDPPLDMDGRIVRSAFSPEYLSHNQNLQKLSGNVENVPQERRAYSEAEEKQITEQLRKLGYI